MKKCIFIIVIIMSIGLSALADTVKITHDKNINVRRKPTTESNVIGTAVAGEEYEYIGTEENGWIHLRLLDGTDGFVSGKMASVIPDKDAVAISNEFGSEERIINEEAEESLNDRFVLYRDVPSMPEPNIDKEINFKGIKWWSDFNTVVDARKKIGFQDFREFYSGVRDVRHWNYGLSNNYDGYELFSRCRAYFCGGQTSFYNRVSSNNPKVAGHEVSGLELFFMVNPEKGNLQNYKKKGVLQFYMAKYTFGDAINAYNPYGGNGAIDVYYDLQTKLTDLYGTPGYLTDSKGRYLKVSYWINKDYAAIILNDTGTVGLTYMAPHAEEKLIKLENQMRQYGTPTPEITPVPTPTPYDIKGL